MPKHVIAKKTRFWTQPSVVKLESKGDPVQEVIARASEVALDAMQAGWPGPPFDPFKLAEYMGISFIPREEVPDARILQTPDGKFKIEYNPNRPRARVRYSIAHELAHTLFPDCGEVVRNRLSRTEQDGAAWQLEMLCNIGAAEFLMPSGSFEKLKEEAMDIDHLLGLRAKFDVSTEALLLRVVRITDLPIGVFASSKDETPGNQDRYQLDYAVFSRSWSKRVPNGTLLPHKTRIAECTGIGFTSKYDESWPFLEGEVHVECVGIPPYPGRSYPRVVGVVCPKENRMMPAAKLVYVKGDATVPRGEGRKIIAHVVNDKSPVWGAGFGLAIRKKWPTAQAAFREWATSDSTHMRLGATFCSNVESDLFAFQMVCQRGYGASNQPRLRYSSLKICLEKLAEAAIKERATIHMPRIGTGEAGGAWYFVQQLIDETLCGRGLAVTVYDLPGNERPLPEPSLFKL